MFDWQPHTATTIVLGSIFAQWVVCTEPLFSMENTCNSYKIVSFCHLKPPKTVPTALKMQIRSIWDKMRQLGQNKLLLFLQKSSLIWWCINIMLQYLNRAEAVRELQNTFYSCTSLENKKQKRLHTYFFFYVKKNMSNDLWEKNLSNGVCVPYVWVNNLPLTLI